jgi:transcriptional regulator with XRE-family HTH domain
MILKELRISRHFSQEQLAQMSGLNVRTIQRIESGKNASLESLKCIAAALDVDVQTLNQEKFMVDKNSDNWQELPFLLKMWFESNILQARPTRKSAVRIEVMLHIGGFMSCCLALISEIVLSGGLMLLGTAYLCHFVKWQGDKYGIWYDDVSTKAGRVKP